MTIVSLGKVEEEWICSGKKSAKSKNSRLIICCIILLGMAGAPGIAEIKGSEAGIGAGYDWGHDRGSCDNCSGGTVGIHRDGTSY